MKRENYISWDQYFMGISELSAMRSKDPNTQVGACIVNSDSKIVGIGYNGFPYKISDDEFPWEKSEDRLDSKYPYVCHAELNAILNSTANLKGTAIYVTHYPCCECAKAIIQSQINKVIYLNEHDKDEASIRLFKSAGIIVEKIEKYQSLKILLEE